MGEIEGEIEGEKTESWGTSQGELPSEKNDKQHGTIILGHIPFIFNISNSALSSIFGEK